MRHPRIAHTLALVFFAAFTVIAASSCDKTDIGGGCSSQDQCESDLQCLPFCGVVNDGSICTISCKTDADCADVGDDAICFSCAGGNVCFPNHSCAGGSCK